MKVLLVFLSLCYFGPMAAGQQIYLYTETLEFKKKSKNIAVVIYLPGTKYPFQEVLKYEFNVEPDEMLSSEMPQYLTTSDGWSAMWHDRVFKRGDIIEAKAILEVRTDLLHDHFIDLIDGTSSRDSLWAMYEGLDEIVNEVKGNSKSATLRNTLSYFRENFSINNDEQQSDVERCLETRSCNRITIDILQMLALLKNGIPNLELELLSTQEPNEITSSLRVFLDNKWTTVVDSDTDQVVLHDTEQIVVPKGLATSLGGKSINSIPVNYRENLRSSQIPMEKPDLEPLQNQDSPLGSRSAARYRAPGPWIVIGKNSKPKFTRKITVVNLSKSVVEPAMEAYHKEEWETCEMLLDSMAALGIDDFNSTYVRSQLLMSKSELPNALINIQYAMKIATIAQEKAKATYLFSKYFRHLGELEKAEELLEKALHLYPQLKIE